LRADWDLKDLRKQFNQRALNVLNPSQQDRLRQIERQMLGGTLLTSVSEQKLLGLTPAQQQSLAVIEKSNQAQATAVTAQFNSNKISSFRKTIDLHRIQQNTSKQMLSVLTPKQKKQWEILSGQKLGLPKIHDPNASTKSLFEGY
jgi:Spy/CpxP family protein refolding chaperone